MTRNRIKFILGIMAAILMVVFPNPAEITSWDLLFHAIIDFVSNPYLIVCAIVSGIGYVSANK